MNRIDRPYTIEQLRRAAHALTNPEAHGLDDAWTPIPRAVVNALLESAFPLPTRGAVYPDEFEDIAGWLLQHATNPTERNRYEDLVATGAAWATDFIESGENAPGGPEHQAALRDLVRAVAIFVLRTTVDLAVVYVEEHGGAR